MASEDWTKKVTLNPPNEVKFKITEDVNDPSLDKSNIKASAKIEIINKSQSVILFKVSILIYVLTACHLYRSKQPTLKIIW